MPQGARSMKTKTIDVWVHRDLGKVVVSDADELRHVVISANDISHSYNKAKLIIELPEKKTEVTESQIVTILKTLNYDEEYRDEIIGAIFKET